MQTRYPAIATVLAVPLAVGLAVGLAACGSSGGGAGAATPQAGAISPRAQIARLSGTDTAVAVQPALTTALKSLGITVGPTGSAVVSTRYGPTTLEFPITGGDVTIYDRAQVRPYVQGIIDHDGSGLEFAGRGRTLTVGNFAVNPGTSSLTATVTQLNDARVPLFTLDGRSLVVGRNSQGQATLDGAKLELTSTAANTLNRTFGVSAFRPGLLVGIAHITAH